MRNLYTTTLPVRAIPSATFQTGATDGTVLDLSMYGNNFQDVMFMVTSVTLTDGTYAITVEESDASGSGFADVASSRILGSLPSFAASDDNTLKSFGVRPSKRYIKLVVTATGATSGGVLSAAAVLGEGGDKPVARA